MHVRLHWVRSGDSAAPFTADFQVRDIGGLLQSEKNRSHKAIRAKGWNLTCKLCTICRFYLLSQQVCWPQTWSICYAFFSLRVTCQAVNILLMKPCEYFQRISPDVQFFPVEAVCRSCVILFDQKCMLFWTVVSSRRNHGVFSCFLGSQRFFGKHRYETFTDFHWQGQFLPDAARCKQLSIEPHGQAGRRTDMDGSRKGKLTDLMFGHFMTFQTSRLNDSI